MVSKTLCKHFATYTSGQELYFQQKFTKSTYIFLSRSNGIPKSQCNLPKG